MHIFEGKDKAIEFEGEYQGLIGIINNIRTIGVDTSEYERDAEKVKTDCDNKITDKKSRVEIELIYDEGIKSLKEIKEKLEKYDIYYTIYYNAKSIEMDLDKDNISEEKIKVYARAIISLLKQINESDTRKYSSEESIVELVYDLAYRIMKIELVRINHSSVLDYVKEDNTVASYLNSEVVKDIDALDEAISSNEFMKNILMEIRKQGSWCSYLNESLLLYIALQSDFKDRDPIEARLYKILEEMKEAEAKKESSNKSTKEIEANISKNKINRKANKILMELGLFLGFLGIFASVNRYGGQKIRETVGDNVYKTKGDFYSNSATLEAPGVPEYMKAIDGWRSTTLTAYGVWHRENIFYGDYVRDIRTYNLNNVNLENLEDFMEIDFENVKYDSITERSEEIDPSELYEEALVEIHRISQDENDVKFIPDVEEQAEDLALLGGISLAILAIGDAFVLWSMIKKLRKRRAEKRSFKENKKNLEKELEIYNRLCKQSKEFRETFIKVYQQYEMYIHNAELKSTYQSFLGEKSDEATEKPLVLQR